MRYQRVVGRLIYLVYTKLDLAYALSIDSQSMHNSGEQHINRYLKSALEKGNFKNTNKQNIKVYTNVDWVKVVDHKWSTTRYQDTRNRMLSHELV